MVHHSSTSSPVRSAQRTLGLACCKDTETISVPLGVCSMSLGFGGGGCSAMIVVLGGRAAVCNTFVSSGGSADERFGSVGGVVGAGGGCNEASCVGWCSWFVSPVWLLDP